MPLNRVARITIGSGESRHVFTLERGGAADLTRLLFATPGRLHKARRRGERALASVSGNRV